MNVSKLNDEAVIETITAIFNTVLATRKDERREFLELLVSDFIQPLEEEDFFGTEGWEHWAGLGD